MQKTHLLILAYRSLVQIHLSETTMCRVYFFPSVISFLSKLNKTHKSWPPHAAGRHKQTWPLPHYTQSLLYSINLTWHYLLPNTVNGKIHGKNLFKIIINCPITSSAEILRSFMKMSGCTVNLLCVYQSRQRSRNFKERSVTYCSFIVSGHLNGLVLYKLVGHWR